MIRKINSVKHVLYPSDLKDGKYGFDNSGKLIPPFAEIRQLSGDELQRKIGLRVITGSARIEHQPSQAE